MRQYSVCVYYMRCRELGCWVLFNDKPRKTTATCRAHGVRLDVVGLKQGIVTEFEARQGWTKQQPDVVLNEHAVGGTKP